MTPEAQRIVIAEACGWKQIEVMESSFQNPLRNVSRGLAWHNPRGLQCRLPDYLDDLNACHEMEKVLLPFDSDRWQDYAYWLAHLTPLGGQDHATAAQRCEAFLRTIGKWKQ